MSNTPQQGKTYEMLWDCKFCGEKKLLGKTHRFCPVCGAAQDPNSRYYPSDDEKVAVEDHKYVGADKICPACSSTNAGNAEYCTECGAPLTDAARAKTLEAQSRAEGGKFESSGSRDLAKERFDAQMAQAQKSAGKKGGVNLKAIIIGVIIVAVIGGVIYALTAKKEATVVVSGHSWTREVRIDQYQTISDGAWQDSLPSDAYNLSCSQRQRSTRQVEDGQTCTTQRVDQGDGTYREEQVCKPKYRDEPVYDQWCDYSADRWEYERSVTANGDSVSPAPNWPDYQLNCSGQSSIGCERVPGDGQVETYVVHFKGDGDSTYDCSFPQDQWQSISDESVWTVKVGVVVTSSVDCSSLASSQ